MTSREQHPSEAQAQALALKWTPYRHRMLRRTTSAAVDACILYVTNLEPMRFRDWYDGPYLRLDPGDQRALRALHEVGLLTASHGSTVKPTDVGRELLAYWDRLHPDFETSDPDA